MLDMIPLAKRCETLPPMAKTSALRRGTADPALKIRFGAMLLDASVWTHNCFQVLINWSSADPDRFLPCFCALSCCSTIRKAQNTELTHPLLQVLA